jgi:signal transduction histidine kinase
MPDKSETSTTAGGLGLRTKLTLGFIGLLVILIAVGVASISLLSDLGGAIDVILRENYKSVIACDRMKEALERLDSGALFALAGEAEQGRALAVQNRPRFEAALQTELGNITLPGEGERAARLQKLYTAYGPALEKVLAAATPAAERHALYFSQLLPVFQQIKGTADEILEMNERAMVAANDRARAAAAEASRSMAVLLLLGTAFAGVCVFFLSRAILGPLERLTWAARRIEGGDLSQTVPVASRDELGQLATAFNSMAAGLRELRESDQALLLRHQRSSQLTFDGMPNAVVLLAADRQVSLGNYAAAALLGAETGRPLPGRHGEWLRPLLDRAEKGQFEEHFPESGVRLPSLSSERFFLPRAARLRDPQGRPEGFLLIVEDVTDRHRASELHASLLANAARDIQEALTPLRPERLGEIAASLREMSLLEERRQQLRPEPIPPGDLLAAAAGRASSDFAEKGVKLETHADPAAPSVLADRGRTELVLSSLLRNALAHTPEGGTVTLRAEAADGRARLTVTDTGDGIPAAHRGRLFERFYQIPGTEDLGGAGLGLANARDLVQAHGGEIHCESEEGHGTTFWLTLPAAGREA